MRRKLKTATKVGIAFLAVFFLGGVSALLYFGRSSLCAASILIGICTLMGVISLAIYSQGQSRGKDK